MDRKPTVVILLADSTRAVALGQSVDGANAASLIVQSSDQFHQVINRECVDLVIIENRLHGFLSGIEILERMHQDLVRPATMLISEPSAEVDRRARKLGVDRVMPPHLSLDEVASAASTILITTMRDRVFVPEKARLLIQQVGAINPLPQLLVRLSSYLGPGEYEAIDELARDISVDARVTAELLRLTNSSAMGRPYKTTNVFDAVRYLGVRRTVATVLSSGIFKAQSSMVRALTPQLRTWYQYRSVLIGSTAASFAGAMENVSSPTAYLLGLLQDIGTLVLGHAFGERYERVLERVNQISHLQREQAEFAEFGTGHAEVSAALMQKWELPPSLVSMVLRHHEHETLADRPQVEQAFARVMRIGERVADLADRRSAKRYLDLNESLSHYGRVKSVECKAALATAVERSVESSRLFSIPLPDSRLIRDLMNDLAAKCGTHASTDPGKSRLSGSVSGSSPPREVDSLGCLKPHGTEVRRRILIVDDDPQIVRLIRKWLDGLPIDVFASDTLQEAITLAQETDLLLCDIHLGRENGHDVIVRLRESDYSKPVIVLSGDTRKEVVERFIQLGVCDFLAKPFNRQRLLASIDAQLSGAAETSIVTAS